MKPKPEPAPSPLTAVISAVIFLFLLNSVCVFNFRDFSIFTLIYVPGFVFGLSLAIGLKSWDKGTVLILVCSLLHYFVPLLIRQAAHDGSGLGFVILLLSGLLMLGLFQLLRIFGQNAGVLPVLILLAGTIGCWLLLLQADFFSGKFMNWGNQQEAGKLFLLNGAICVFQLGMGFALHAGSKERVKTAA